MQASRRTFLRIRTGNTEVQRPPWAVGDAIFIEKCTRCHACVDACPTHLLVNGQGGFPEADFTPGRAVDGCTFCRKCLVACQDGALLDVPGQLPWSLQATFSAACLAAQDVVCRTCGEVCEAQAICFPPSRGGISRPQLKTGVCTGCGACLADCPTQAIRISPASLNHIPTQGAA